MRKDDEKTNNKEWQKEVRTNVKKNRVKERKMKAVVGHKGYRKK